MKEIVLEAQLYITDGVRGLFLPAYFICMTADEAPLIRAVGFGEGKRLESPRIG